MVKLEIEKKEPITVGFFILQYASLRMLELFFNCFANFCNTVKFEKNEMDTGSIRLRKICKIPCEKKDVGVGATAKQRLWHYLTADVYRRCFPRTCCAKKQKKTTRKNLCYPRWSFVAQNCCVCVAKSIVVATFTQRKHYKLCSKRLNIRFLKDIGDGPMAEIWWRRKKMVHL